MPQDKALAEEVEGAGPLSDDILTQIGTYGIDSQAVTRSIIRAIAALERRTQATFADGSNPEFPHSQKR